MKVDYDSEAHSLLFEFSDFRPIEDGDYSEELADSSCIVRVHEGRAEGILLLYADKDISRLDEAAERFDLDADGLRAAARAALAAPDREIKIEVGKDLTLEDDPVPTGATRPSG
jgi:hypothetical protein